MHSHHILAFQDWSKALLSKTCPSGLYDTAVWVLRQHTHGGHEHARSRWRRIGPREVETESAHRRWDHVHNRRAGRGWPGRKAEPVFQSSWIRLRDRPRICAKPGLETQAYERPPLRHSWRAGRLCKTQEKLHNTGYRSGPACATFRSFLSHAALHSRLQIPARAQVPATWVRDAARGRSQRSWQHSSAAARDSRNLTSLSDCRFPAPAAGSKY